MRAACPVCKSDGLRAFNLYGLPTRYEHLYVYLGYRSQLIHGSEFYGADE